jgi:hypothetical protein
VLNEMCFFNRSVDVCELGHSFSPWLRR